MNEDLRNEIVRRWREGASQRTIACSLGLSRGTVHRVLSRHESERGGQSSVPLRRPSLLDAYETVIRELVGRYPAITVTRLLEELRARGFTVHTCRNGNDAVDLLHHRPVDVVVSDVVMEGLVGTGLLREIRACPGGMQIPVVSAPTTPSTSAPQRMSLFNGALSRTSPSHAAAADAAQTAASMQQNTSSPTPPQQRSVAAKSSPIAAETATASSPADQVTNAYKPLYVRSD